MEYRLSNLQSKRTVLRLLEHHGLGIRRQHLKR